MNFRTAYSFAFIASLSHFIVPIVQMLLASPLRNSGKHQRRHYDPFYISSNLARPRFRWLLSSDRFRPDAWRECCDIKLYERNARSDETTSEHQSLMRTSYAVFCLKNNTHTTTYT